MATKFNDAIVKALTYNDRPLIELQINSKRIWSSSNEHVHTWTPWSTVVSSTCISGGMNRRECTSCGAIQTEEVPIYPNRHIWNDWTITLEPTCTTSGERTRTCSLSSSHIETEEIAELGHTLSDWIIDVEPTETTEGRKHRECTRCGIVETETMPITSLEFSLMSNGTYSVRGKDANISGEIVIPSTYNGKAVTWIDEGAFSGWDSIIGVVIPDSVKIIDNEAFYGCSSLARVVIPSNVESIGDYAFAQCHNLSSVVLEDGVINIQEWAFGGCENLTSIIIPNSVKYINDYVFYDCINLSSITIGNGVEHIGYMSGDNVFYNTAYYNNPENWVDGMLYIDGYLIAVKNTETEIQVAYSCNSISAGIISASGGKLLAIVKIPLNVQRIQPKAFYQTNNAVIYCEAVSKPDGWADDWCDDSVTVVWGYTETEDTNTYLITESGDNLTDEAGNLLII